MVDGVGGDFSQTPVVRSRYAISCVDWSHCWQLISQRTFALCSTAGCRMHIQICGAVMPAVSQ